MTTKAGQYGPDAIWLTDSTPARSVAVAVFEADGTTPSVLYSDQDRGSTVANPTATDSNGNLLFYAEPGLHVLVINLTSIPVQVPVNPVDDLTVVPVVFSVPGVQTVSPGTSRWYLPEDYTLVAVHAGLGTAPAGADLVIDLNYNGTTVYADPSHRPRITPGTFHAVGGVASVTALDEDSYLTVDVDQIGAGVPGTDLVVTPLLQRRGL